MRELIYLPGHLGKSLDITQLNLGTFDAPKGCFSPSDIEAAHHQFKANCGPASFAAVSRLPVADAMRFFPHFPARDWTTKGDMRRAFQASSVAVEERLGALPTFGVALIQFQVDERPLHPLFSLGMTHWVGVWKESFYDVNWGGWLPISIWREIVLPRFRFKNRRVVRWGMRDSFEIVGMQGSFSSWD